ncbi:MAG: hypothetical protein U9N06_02170 [candidate division WOR-3 bacterium]|nr:hypothetical protein [candidate division WOR-3 bacterium]
MEVKQEIRTFKGGYLLNIQNTSGIALNKNYIRNADINKLYEMGVSK